DLGLSVELFGRKPRISHGGWHRGARCTTRETGRRACACRRLHRVAPVGASSAVVHAVPRKRTERFQWIRAVRSVSLSTWPPRWGGRRGRAGEASVGRFWV